MEPTASTFVMASAAFARANVIRSALSFMTPSRQQLGPRTQILPEIAMPVLPEILTGLADIAAAAPFRHMTTPGGFVMSVEMTNCGALGWVSDRTGYRYDATDPLSGRAWPAMPAHFFKLASQAAAEAGYKDFSPDGCLINRYQPGAKMSLHQDKNEQDFDQPIVSLSLGLPATFLFGGLNRADKAQRIELMHGDVLVWGGPDRLRYHGILPLKEGQPLFSNEAELGGCRINLTFRRAG